MFYLLCNLSSFQTYTPNSLSGDNISFESKVKHMLSILPIWVLKIHGSSQLTVFAISCTDHVTGVEIAEKINAAIRPNDDLLTIVRYWICLRGTGTSADQTILQNIISRTKKKHPERDIRNNCIRG